MRSRLLSMLIADRPNGTIKADTARHGLNFIKLDGDIGCLGKWENSKSMFLR